VWLIVGIEDWHGKLESIMLNDSKLFNNACVVFHFG
jgi:hypothetical protein